MDKNKFKTLTKKELHETAVERVHLIAKEFTATFDFLKDYPKSVSIFGGVHYEPDSGPCKKAQSLGARIATDLKYAVVTGGSIGIMEAANRGAFEAGGQSIGLTIELPTKQANNKYLTANLDFYYFFSRKVALAFSAEAYVFFPGGFGTIDEFFEIITLVQTAKIEKVPVILVGSDFWIPLQDWMKKELLANGAVQPEDLTLYTITDDENEIIDIIRNAPTRNGVEFPYKSE